MKELLDIFKKIEKPGDFCASGIIEPCFLGLEVAHIGPIALPLIETQAKEIIKQCSQAPYGRGEKTIVDTKVRSTWQLEPEQFQIKNSEWNIKIAQVIQQIKEQLGLGDNSVSYELYKCLLYEKGDFFDIHRDTEKSENMFATLVVVLPSDFEGGDLIVYHDGEKKTFSFSKRGQYHIQYAAFYADCQHEVTPVTRGYRLCLIYNLALTNSRQQPLAPKYSVLINEASEALKTWALEGEQEKLAFLLEHQYTQAGISFYGLKSSDRSIAHILVKAAEEAICNVYLGLITLWESGSIDEYNYDYSRDEDYEIEELFDRSLSINYWKDTDDKDIAFGEITVDEDEIISQRPIGEGKPDEEEVEGPTGNAGSSMERWYHRAAIIIWPKHLHFTVLSQASHHVTIPKLNEITQNWIESGQSKDDELWRQCRLFASEIIKRWSPSRWSHHYRMSNEENAIKKEMFNILLSIGEVDLIKLYLHNIVSKEFSGVEGPDILLISKQYGWLTFYDALNEMISREEFNKLVAFVQILEQLCFYHDNDKDNSDQLQLCKKLSKTTVDAIMECDETKKQIVGATDKILLIKSLFKALISINEIALLENSLEHFILKDNIYTTREVFVLALKQIWEWIKTQPTSVLMLAKKPYFRLLEYCIADLKNATSTTIEEPKDWAQNIQLTCNCANCKTLQTFLLDPEMREYQFRVKQETREHLQNQITKNHCDMACATVKKGTPYSLVCKKTRDSYHKQLEQRKVDLNLLAELDEIDKQLA